MMMKRRNTVQTFIRTVIRFVIIIPLLLIFVYPDFQKLGDMVIYGLQGDLTLRLAGVFLKTVLIF